MRQHATRRARGLGRKPTVIGPRTVRASRLRDGRDKFCWCKLIRTLGGRPLKEVVACIQGNFETEQQATALRKAFMNSGSMCPRCARCTCGPPSSPRMRGTGRAETTTGKMTGTEAPRFEMVTLRRAFRDQGEPGSAHCPPRVGRAGFAQCFARRAERYQTRHSCRGLIAAIAVIPQSHPPWLGLLPS